VGGRCFPAMTSFQQPAPATCNPHDTLQRQLVATERVLKDVLDQLAQAEAELKRYRSAAQIEARRGY
jgi:hypothetical protein